MEELWKLSELWTYTWKYGRFLTQDVRQRLIRLFSCEYVYVFYIGSVLNVGAGNVDCVCFSLVKYLQCFWKGCWSVVMSTILQSDNDAIILWYCKQFCTKMNLILLCCFSFFLLCCVDVCVYICEHKFKWRVDNLSIDTVTEKKLVHMSCFKRSPLQTSVIFFVISHASLNQKSVFSSIWFLYCISMWV